MKIKFCGAAQTVTGSCHLLTLDSGFTILMDAGLYQGRDEDFEEFNSKWEFKPEHIDCMLVSHAHIDHTGRVPKLTKDGFAGDIICTSATRDLCALLLMDSAHIQESEANYFNKRYGGRKAEKYPLYTKEDAKLCLEQFIGVGYNRWYKINEEVSVLFRDAGHILGSASISLRITREDGSDTYFGFTGDIGRPDRPILRDPQPMEPMDYLICESTYAGKTHQGMPNDEKDLLKVINDTCVKRKGKLIIPAFSVGRTQELIYMMDKLETAGKLPKIPVYIDSPLAINATDVFTMHPECYDADILDYMTIDPNPFGFGGLKMVRSANQSKGLNDLDDPCIIVSASGMMTAGRIKHHIINNIDNPNNTLLIVGFCAPGTLGERLRNKPETVKIYGKEKTVRADIVIMDSFSAHGDQGEIMDFLQSQNKKKLKKVFLVHGMPNRQVILKEALLEDGYQSVEMPELGEEVELF